MVCVPCFIIPVLLVIWRLFIQPILLRFWNPWEKKDEKGNIIKPGTDFPFQCVGGTCKFIGSNKKNEDNPINNETEVECEKTKSEDLKKQQ